EADLAPLALDLAVAGIRDPSELRWIDPPAAGSYEVACELLRELGLIDDDRGVTDEGSRAGDLPLHPRLAHMIVHAPHSNLKTACDVAALLGERDILRFERPDAGSDPDIRLRLEILEAARNRRGSPAVPGATVQSARVQRVLREAERLARTAYRRPSRDRSS